MGFLDKAKAAAMDLQAKADTALANSGMMGGSPGGPMGGGPRGHAEADRLLRDLGVLTYLNAGGRPGSADDYQRILGSLQQLEARGQLGSLTVGAPLPAPGMPPPPPGAVAASAAPPPPPVSASVPPPVSASVPPPPGAADAALTPDTGIVDVAEEVVEIDGGGGDAPPPPPPSWA